MKDDEILTTRDLLQYGFRNNVDKVTSRLVKIKVIKRIARGVFIKRRSKTPSAWQIANAKARAFGKRIVTHGKEIARELSLVVSNEKPQLVYLVEGRTSSFRSAAGRIYMRGVVAKKMFGGETPVGRIVRAICSIGREITVAQLDKAIMLVHPSEHHLLLKAGRWMSWWLYDAVRETMFCSD